jgi:hypothetical protein
MNDSITVVATTTFAVLICCCSVVTSRKSYAQQVYEITAKEGIKKR